MATPERKRLTLSLVIFSSVHKYVKTASLEVPKNLSMVLTEGKLWPVEKVRGKIRLSSNETFLLELDLGIAVASLRSESPYFRDIHDERRIRL